MHSICQTEPEDVIHFLTRCRELSQLRAYYLREMNSYMLERHESKSELINEIFSDNYNTAKLIIDCTAYHFLRGTSIGVRAMALNATFNNISWRSVSLPLAEIELTTLEVIDTDCTGSCKSNYHRTLTAPTYNSLTSF